MHEIHDQLQTVTDDHFVGIRSDDLKAILKDVPKGDDLLQLCVGLCEFDEKKERLIAHDFSMILEH